MKSRASIFEEVQDIDLSSFRPKIAPDNTAPSLVQVREVTEKAQFRSREANPETAAQPIGLSPDDGSPQRHTQRRHRTGRNVQLNIKATPETVTVFNAVTDANGWVAGETLARALAALQRELERGGET